MACDATTLTADSRCLAEGMFNHQLLAYIAYQLAVNASEDPTPQNLTTLGECISEGMSDHQMLAAITYLQCQLNGG